MKTFEFEGKRYKAQNDNSRNVCDGCIFRKDVQNCSGAGRQARAAGLPDCMDGFIYILAEDKPTPAGIARRIGEEAATYAEQAIANKIAEALENM